MKLLFDQNLAPRLVDSLNDIYPGSIHVRKVELSRADDESIWDFARQKGLAIVSKDSDFHQLSFLRGHPPKVIWIRCGNCSTQEIEAVLRKNRVQIEEFEKDEVGAFLIVE